MALTTTIILKTGVGEPSTMLTHSEPAFDASNNILWVGNNNTSTNIPFYSGIPGLSFNVIRDGNAWDVNYSDTFECGSSFSDINTDTVSGGSF